MNRRDMLKVALMFPAAAVAACNGQSMPALPISITLPPSLTQLINDVETLVLPKLETLTSAVPSITALVGEGETLLTQLKGSGLISDAASLIGVLGQAADLLPPPYGTIAAAVTTVLQAGSTALGLRMARMRPTGMTIDQARATLRG